MKILRNSNVIFYLEIYKTLMGRQIWILSVKLFKWQRYKYNFHNLIHELKTTINIKRIFHWILNMKTMLFYLKKTPIEVFNEWVEKVKLLKKYCWKSTWWNIKKLGLDYEIWNIS